MQAVPLPSGATLRPMPLITRDEACRLGKLTDYAEIEALVQRAWEARVERFAAFQPAPLVAATPLRESPREVA